MNLKINGTLREVSSAHNLSDVVSAFCKNPRAVITELNGVIIPAEKRPQAVIKDGDTLELVSFVGGG